MANRYAPIFPLIMVSILVVVIVLMSFLQLYDQYHQQYCDDSRLSTITDIIQVSQGGLGADDRCIFMTTTGKRTYTGSDCDKQIGEKVCN